MQRDGIANTFIVAILTCLVCSTAVSIAAIALRGPQEFEKQQFNMKNILQVADRYDDEAKGDEMTQKFETYIQTKIVDLATGEYVDAESNPILSDFDMDIWMETSDADKTLTIKSDQDIASIKTRSLYANVYLESQSSTNPAVRHYVFPIRGKGLWSIMKGYIAVESDLKTVRGITFYEDGETPGLGGEINNEKWKASWQGKLLFNEETGAIDIEVVKGAAKTDFEIDGLSGATITSNGVTYMLQYWLGDSGFGPYLKRLKAEQANQVSSEPKEGGE